MKRNRVLAVMLSGMLMGGIGLAPGLRAQANMNSARMNSAPMTAQAAYAADAGRLGQKFVALAGAMTGKYDWRPMEGVRSVSDVFNLMLRENGMLTHVLESGTMQGGAKMEPINDPAKMQDALRASYDALQKTISGMTASQMKEPVKMFGREMTKEGALSMLLSDQHEHLGQSIAYARMNHVVPPWSKPRS
jgi:uncharacterized damage-inducible protein DinB